MKIITRKFVDKIIAAGELTEARHRIECRKAQSQPHSQSIKATTWSLVCEEILDTEDTPSWYDRVVEELYRRDFNHEQIDAMRRFAWATVGWLNYDRYLWEWVLLDERHIELALDQQLLERLITTQQHAIGMGFLAHPETIASSGVAWYIADD